MKTRIIIITFFFGLLISCKTDNPNKKEINKPKIICGNPDPSSEAIKGKDIFLRNCAHCHNNDMISDMTGPTLSGVTERWENSLNALSLWIQNSQKLVDEKHPIALKLKSEWSNFFIHEFSSLDSTQIDHLLEYIEFKSY